MAIIISFQYYKAYFIGRQYYKFILRIIRFVFVKYSIIKSMADLTKYMVV